VEHLVAALEKVPKTPILINMVARRVRQLHRGFRPYVKREGPSEPAVDIALREIAEGKMTSEITFDALAEAPAAES